MIGGCISSAKYSMYADVYKKVRTNSESGQIVSRWVFDKTISCVASSFTSSSYNAQGANEFFNSKTYKLTNYVKLKAKQALPRSTQVTNIRDKATGEVFYTELELKDLPSTWFNVNGSAPIFLMSEIMEYEMILDRASEQGEIT